ncbi:conserved hypothetical protein [Ixodes scapularis]|uniref:Cytoplasmic tRNA 2-thiolation protein 2 n=1 Tax=Ixodes scapularis TaxID=6945 RepID=B7PNH8_IXOSC|nr:conserved hypothetical protein [Ixodes scapularis]|eukprot:XP_002435326.1 conserved hypothetical protein [Ixodes scapularis]
MCSTLCECDGIPDAVPPVGILEDAKGNTCKTCDDTAHVVLRKKDAYCVSCFLAASTHKFRSTLGKSKLIKPKQKILVAFSGGPSSAAMLTLLLDGFAEDAHKRFLFEPHLAHIDDSVASGKSEADPSLREEAVSLMSSSNLPFYTVPLELVVCSDVVTLDPATHGSTVPIAEVDGCRRTLASSFSSFKSATDRESFHRITLRRLLLKLARDNGFDKVFTAETGTQLAATLLSTIALGRGSQLRDQVSFVDDRDGHIQLLRPMREFSAEEVDLFNQHRNVTFRQSPPKQAASIVRLTERFVNGLQRDFPATVSTIWRTGDKIAPPVRTAGSCSLCGSPLDTVDVPVASAVEALRLTRETSRQREGEGRTSLTTSEDEGCRELCYACQSMMAAGDRATMKPLLDSTNPVKPQLSEENGTATKGLPVL